MFVTHLYFLFRGFQAVLRGQYLVRLRESKGLFSAKD